MDSAGTEYSEEEARAAFQRVAQVTTPLTCYVVYTYLNLFARLMGGKHRAGEECCTLYHSTVTTTSLTQRITFFFPLHSLLSCCLTVKYISYPSDLLHYLRLVLSNERKEEVVHIALCRGLHELYSPFVCQGLSLGGGNLSAVFVRI